MTADGSPVDLTGNTFVMPAGDVSVNVTFVGKIYNITLSPAITGGNVVVSEAARMGTTVSLSPVPETNHELISLTVRTRSGSSVAVTGNTFVMPAGNVVVNAVFWNKTDFVAVTGGNVSGDADGYGSAVFIDGRDVTIRNLWVCNHEVTQKEYLTYCKYGDSVSLGSGTGDNMPVYHVNWYDAIVYCNLRSIAEGLTPVYSIGGMTHPSSWPGVTGSGGKYCGPSGANTTFDGVSMNMNANGYRLPTSLEWEYAARSGNNGVMETYLYSGGDNVDTVAWYSGNSENQVHTIKTKSPNSLNIYDMSGNVWEWCWDWSGPVSATTGETGPVSSSSGRCTAGWDCKTAVYEGYTMELAIPGASAPYERGESSSVIGFRVVRTR
ncbi:MAG: SUMF1/EgtB/PvdO family nonheme iron enzyme [Treponema sp.]|nr:SUMF1/EgtB/PvdO family nonheme iron enzyme [Treponema sp.]